MKLAQAIFGLCLAGFYYTHLWGGIAKMINAPANTSMIIVPGVSEIIGAILVGCVSMILLLRSLDAELN